MIKPLFLVLALAGPVLGQGSKYVGQSFRDFRGGLNDNTPASYLELNESPDALNVVIDEPLGALTQRNGLAICGYLPSGNTPTALFPFTRSDGSTKLIVTDNQNYYQTGDCLTYTTIKSGLSSAANPTFTIVRNKLWVANKSTNVFTWDGANTVLLDGGANTPNPAPPICAYLQYWRNRVWCARSNSYPSGLYFSSLYDSAGTDIDPSTGTASWAAINLIQVQQDDGYPIMGLKTYRGELYAFKPDAIYKISFENEFNISVVKTLSSVGTKFQTSIVELDNLLYFVGPDGIYAFDGDSSARLSDKTLNRFYSLRQPAQNSLYNTWTTKTQFDACALSSTTASLIDGSVLLDTHSVIITNGDFELGLSSWTTYANNPTPSVETTVLNSVSTSAVAPLAGTYSMVFNANRCNLGDPYTQGSATSLEYKIIDGLGQILSGPTAVADSPVSVDLSGLTTDYMQVVFQVAGLLGSANINAHSDYFTYNPSTHNKILFSYSSASAQGAGCPESYYDTYKIDSVKKDLFYTSGTIRSDVFYATSVSTWSTFEFTASLNGGSLPFQYRVGTSTTALAAKAWTDVISGALISGTTSDLYIQWQATATAATVTGDSPELKDVIVNYIVGGDALQNVHSAVWKNRLWISASSGTSTTNNIQLVKTRHPLTSWIPYDMPIGPMAKWADNFFAGSSTGAAIFRADYGANDFGKAINSHWISKDEFFGLPQNAKGLQEIALDYEGKTAASVDIGYSRDSGNSWTDKTVSLPGTGRKTKSLLVNGGNSTQFRFRIKNSSLDKTYKIFGLEALAIPYKFRE